MADKNNRGKKGISPVIATVLLVSIVIVMGLIIFLVARNFIKEPVTKFGSSADEACTKIAGNLVNSYDGQYLVIDNQDDELTLYGINSINEDGDSTEAADLNILPGLSSGEISVGAGVTKFSPIIKGETKDGTIVAYTCKDEIELSSS